MHARKARMAALSDGVVVLPGGFGTCDETFEILTWNQLGLLAIPVVFFDVDGFYRPLFEFVGNAVFAGFLRPEHGALALRAESAAEAVSAATQTTRLRSWPSGSMVHRNPQPPVASVEYADWPISCGHPQVGQCFECAAALCSY